MNANLNYKSVYQIKNSIKNSKYFDLKKKQFSEILDN